MIDLRELLPPPLVETLGSILLHFVWQGALVGILLFLALTLLQRHSAQIRYGAALLALVGMLTLPLATALWLVVPPPKAALLSAPAPQLERVTEPSTPILTTVIQREHTAPPTPATAFIVSSPSFPVRVGSAASQASGTIPLHESLPLLVAVWFIGVMMLSLRFLISWVISQQLRSQATTLAPQALQRALRRLSKSLRISRSIRLLESGIVHAPIVVGWLSPVILLPTKVVESFSLEKLEPILTHELAHICRNDWLVIVLQRLAETLFFYHPVVWWLSNVLEKEREYSCDDIAAAACGNPKAYAQALAELEVLRGTNPQLVLAANGGPLLKRIRRLIMASSVRTQAHSPARAVAGSLAMATLLAVIVLGFGPKLAFAQVAYNEAPMLVQRVAAGELPSVEERLPANPLVVEPLEEIGNYGGTFRLLVRRGDWSMVARYIAYENLVRWNFEWTEVIPNVAESFEVNEDATEFIFHLREGLRWSDGEPYTADDIVFWYEDIIMNREITPVVSDTFMAGDEPGMVEKIDDYTVRISFAAPNAFFLQYLATLHGPFWGMTNFPRHFLELYHPDYSDGADARARERGFTSAIDFLQSLAGISLRFDHGGVPVLWPWAYDIESNPWGRQQIVLERNPYYWKVDPDGQQLPYMDSINFQILDDIEALLLRAMGGELDLGNRNLALETKPLFFDNMERGDYRIFDVYSSDNNAIVISLNLTHRDPIIREIFQNKDFRIGLSHAMDRQEIIDLVFVGQGEPWQPAPRPGSPVYSERLGTQYTEFDLDLANEHLDRAGLTERDAQGFRLRPDGQRLSFSIDTVSGRAIHFIDILEIISQQWREVGIDMHVNVIERGFFYERKDNNLHDGAVWSGNGGTEALLEPRWYFPYSNESNFAPAWTAWYNPALVPNVQAEEPPAATRQQMELYDQIRATGDQDEQIRLMTEILEIAADEFYTFGITLPPTEFGIAANRLRNTPDWMYGSWLWPTPAPTNPEQFFISQ